MKTAKGVLHTEMGLVEVDTFVLYCVKLVFIHLLQNVEFSPSEKKGVDLPRKEGFDLLNEQILFRDIDYHEDDYW